MIILTGASGGIGQSIISSLSKIDDLVGIYNCNKPDSSNDCKAEYFKINLLESDSIQKFIDNFGKKLNNITVVHAAAVKIDQLAIHYDEINWNKVIDGNLKSNFLLTKALLPLMVQQDWGRIISFSSTGAVKGTQGTLAYSVSKSGLTGLTRVYATEYARFGVTANLLSLGYFNCGLYDELDKDVQNKLKSEIPSKKLGDVINISNAVEFLIKSDFINGATINIDGGI